MVKKLSKDESNKEFEEVFLTVTSDVVELEYIADMLDDLSIHYRIDKVSEQFVPMFYGKSAPAFNIYVDKERLGEAKELIKPVYTDRDELETGLEYKTDELQEDRYVNNAETDSQQKVIKKYKRAFLYVFLFPLWAL